MSDERFEQEEAKTEDEDVEAHKKHVVAATDEPNSDESDDVEAHARRAKHREM